MKKTVYINEYFLVMEQLDDHNVEGKLYITKSKEWLESYRMCSFDMVLYWGARAVYHWTNKDPVIRTSEEE